MMLARAELRHFQGQNSAADTELSTLADQAAIRGDPAVRSIALRELTFQLFYLGDLERGLNLGKEALTAAEIAAQLDLKVGALVAIGLVQTDLGDHTAARQALEHVQAIPGPLPVLAQLQALRLAAFYYARVGDMQQVHQAGEQGLRLARSSGKRFWEGTFLNSLSISSTDISLQLSYQAQALVAFTDAGDHLHQNMIHINISNNLMRLGLFKHAQESAMQVLETSHNLNLDIDALYILEILGEINCELGNAADAQNYFREARDLAQKYHMPFLEAVVVLGDIRNLLYQERPREALEFLDQPPIPLSELPWQGIATWQIFQAGALQQMGREKEARSLTLQVLGSLEGKEFSPSDFIVDEACWWGYRSLATRPGGAISEERWRALALGIQFVMGPIANLSDAGLRRGYLHRLAFRRLLVREWLKWAPSRAEPHDLATYATLVQRPGRLNDVFQRLLKVGVRLNAQRDPALLPVEIVEEVSELTGAERIALVLLDEQGNQCRVEIHLPLPAPASMSLAVEPPGNLQNFLAEIEPWLDQAAITHQGFVKQLNPGGALLEQSSLLVSPLVSQGKLVGILYCDLSGCFGRFDQDDLDLLSVLANQSAVAISNADWSTNLEQKVAERTNQLEVSNQALSQRNAELAIITSVQSALATELKIQGIYETVGEKIRELFHKSDLSIRIYDPETNTGWIPYMIEKGQRFSFPPGPLPTRGFMAHVIRTRETLVINENAAEAREKFGSVVFTGTQPDKSAVFVPMLVGEQVRGMIVLSDVEHEHAFSDSEVRLLQTLANSMSVALENARLFDETQRLLNETRQQNNELAIINSIQQGLAAELDFQAIVDLVGDKLSEVLQTGDLGIRWYDASTHLIHYLYEFEHGKRLFLEPMSPKPGGFFEQMLGDHQPKIINTQEEELKLTTLMPGTDLCMSSIDVPIISSDRVLGVIHLEDYEREYAYGESEQRLLSTIAATLGAALENAHLFAETQRLLKETEQRSNELAILNSVGEGMAKSLDVKTVTHIVGDKVRDIFNAEVVSISLLDPQTNLIHSAYEYDLGEGGYVDYIEPFPLGKGMSSEVINTRQPLNLGTSEEQTAHGAYLTPELIELSSGNLALSWLGVPIIVNDQVLGLVGLGAYHEHAFNDNHMRLLQTLSSNMGVAIENARLFQAEQERITELQIINTIQQGLAAELDFQAIVDLVGDHLREVFKTPDLMITWYDEKTHWMNYLYNYEHGTRLYIPSQPPNPEGIFFKISKSRQPLVWNTQDEGDAISPTIPGTDSSKSGVAVPIISGDRVLGVIQIENYERDNAYRESELRLLTTIAASLGASLENARLFAEIQRLLKETEQRSNELAILNSVSEACSKTLDVKTVTRTVGEKIIEIFTTDSVSIMLFDAQTNMIQVSYEYDKNEGGVVDYIEPFPLGTGLASKVIVSRQPLIVHTLEDEIANGAYFPPEVIARGAGNYSQSWLGVPVIAGDRLLGVVGLASYQERAFNENHLRLLQTLASNMGVAIENARLYQAEQERVAELQIINSIQQGLAAELDFQAIVDLVGDKLCQVFGTPDLAISWYDDAQKLLVYLYIVEHSERLYLTPQSSLASGIFQGLLRTRQPVVWNTQEEGDHLSPNIPGTDASKSGVAVPIISGDRVLGKIQMENFERERAYGESELRLLTTIAATLGTALENARLFNETQRLLKETEQRNAELAVINSIQQGLAAELNFQAIVDLVGDKLRQVLNTGEIGIRWFDPGTGLVHYLYEYEHGVRLTIPPMKPQIGGTWSRMIETRQPVVINNQEDLASSGTTVVPGTDQSKSGVFVPLIRSDQVIGSIVVEDYEKEYAFSDSDVRLLQTVANSMGVALENARLFDETQRLLKETEERNAELAVINSVQEALAAELNIQGIYDAVGDKISGIFQGMDIDIRVYDAGTNILSFPYSYENGKRIKIDPAVMPETGFSPHVIRTGETIVVNENVPLAMEKYGSRLIEGTLGEKSLVMVPMLSRGQARGCIMISDFHHENAFTDSDVRLLQTLSNSMSVALENAVNFEAEKLARRQTEALYHVARSMIAYENLTELLQTLANRVVEALPAFRVILVTLDMEARKVTNFVPGGEGADPNDTQTFEQLNEGLTGWVIQERQPAISPWDRPDERECPDAQMRRSETGCGDVLVAPLLFRERILGTLTAINLAGGPRLGEQELDLLVAMANQIAVALENARLFQEEQERLAELAIINSVQSALAAELNIQGIYETVGNKIREIFHQADVGIRIYDPQTNLIHYPFCYESGERITIETQPLTTQGFAAHVLRTKETVLVNENMEQKIQEYGSFVLPGTAMAKSVLFVPLIVGDQARGLIDIVDTLNEKAFSDSDVRLLQTLANSMSVALENARLFDETQRRARETAALAEVGRDISSTLDLNTLMERIASYAKELLRGDSSAIYLPDPMGKVYHAIVALGYEAEEIASDAIHVGEGLIGRLAQTGQAEYVNDTLNDPRTVAVAGTDLRAEERLIIAPLLAGEKVTGMMAVWRTGGSRFVQTELDFLVGLARQAAVAIENARLFDESRRLLHETEKRAAELAAVNAVSSALASELELKALINLVGEQVRTTFNADIA
ncbi:MAG: GAF domain-containing protein [Anaerolineales bacterium]|nr:GAF domain-containing protein [Anaerolineales bacterium]